MKLDIRHLFVAVASMVLASCQVIPADEQLLEVFTPEEKDSTVIKRTSLLIEFSGWRCVNCPNAAAEAHKLLDIYGEELVVVVMHPASNPNTRYGKNEAVNYTCPEADSIYVKMGGTNATPFPTGNVNMLNTSGEGEGYFFAQDKWATLLSQASREVVPVTLENEVTYNEGEVEVIVTTNNHATTDLTATLQVWLTEDSIVGKQKMPDNTTNDSYEHNHLLRGSISPLWGEQATLAAGSEAEHRYQYSLPEKVVAENCNVVSVLTVNGVVVQVKETKITTK